MDWKEAIVLGLSLADILGLICVLGTVWGIKMMSSPVTAVAGNLLGAVSMAGAIMITLVSEGILSQGLLWAGMAVGTIIGYWSALKVTMLQMPQAVAILNGLGGGSSALVSLLTLLAGASATAMAATGLSMGMFEQITAVLGLIVGGVTLSGSVVAGARLHGVMKSRPIIFKGQMALNNATLAVTVLFGAVSLLLHGGWLFLMAILTLIGSLVYGVLFTIRVGGADMPITVSLLNSFSGVAASISGFAISNPLLISIGAVVGASGLILTQIMCRAMNRSLGQVLSGPPLWSSLPEPRRLRRTARRWWVATLSVSWVAKWAYLSRLRQLPNPPCPRTSRQPAPRAASLWCPATVWHWHRLRAM